MSEMVERVGEDHLQVVEQNLPGNLAFSLGLNCQVFFDSCRFLQLARAAIEEMRSQTLVYLDNGKVVHEMRHWGAPRFREHTQ